MIFIVLDRRARGSRRALGDIIGHRHRHRHRHRQNSRVTKERKYNNKNNDTKYIE